MADNLTPQQREAVQNRGGKLLVSAAAGSGKTKVLVDRLLLYLQDPVAPANLDEFVIITYTKAAASELRGKIAAKLTEAIANDPENHHLQRQMQRLFLTKISTVHGFCSDLLREYAYRLDLAADFRVMDENECQQIRETILSDLLDQAYESAGENPDFRAFVDSQGFGRTDALAGQIVLKVYDSARCHLNPQQWLEQCVQASQVEDLSDAAQTIWGKYLMDDFMAYLDCQIAAIAQCAQRAERAENMEKPAINLRDTLCQLRHLRESNCWDEVVTRKNIDFGRLTFPRKGIDEALAEQIKASRNACKKGIEKYIRSFADPSALVLADLQQTGAGTWGLIQLVRQFDQAYDRAKRSRRVLDFADLEHKTLDLLLGTTRNGPTAAAREISARFREIMVDEYQDSNGVQDAIFMALTEQTKNCFMVGDVKQSIYQFRLADPGIFLEKYRVYAPASQASPGEGRKVMLSANFRSGAEIISAVNDIFGDCMSPAVGGLSYGEQEQLREGIPHARLPDAAVELYGIEVQQSTYDEEPAFVAQRIRQMLDSGTLIRDGNDFRPVRQEDIVILLRSPGSVGAHFQRALEAQGIRCASGGGVNLLQTKEIGTLWSILQTIANPRQDIPLLSALANPIFGFTADDLAAFRGKHRMGCIYDALLQESTPQVEAFLRKLTILREASRTCTIAQLIEKIFTLTRMDSVYSAMDGGAARAANLQTFYQLAADYESAGRKTLGQFLEYLQLMEEKGLVTAAESSGDAVTLMSIHKSKGLEFPVVFLCGLSREFNRENLREQVLCDRELGLGLSVADRQSRIRYPSIAKRAIMTKAASESVSEELRVLYVALTRARDRLVMTYASRNLQSDLEDIALRADLGGELLTRDVVCPGEWVLLSALRRTEAGEFHNLGGRPAQTRVSSLPWHIQVVQATQTDAVCVAEQTSIATPAGTEEKLRDALAFHYAYDTATKTPSKQTVTQRKGRFRDEEAAEQAPVPKETHRNWRMPSFKNRKVQGKTYGTTIHTLMQYIRYEACTDEAAVAQEIARMAQQKVITPEQAAMADIKGIAAFFETEPGRKLCSGTPYVREFKFSILDDGSHYMQGLDGEQVLLQGVVDCALLEEDGITVVDFKTDTIEPGKLESLAEYYAPQVQTYAHALSRIYQKPIKKACLYFFHVHQIMDV